MSVPLNSFKHVSGLFHLQNQSFQVFPFGMIYIDRVIGRLCQLMQDSNLSSRYGSSAEDSQSELFLCDSLRAGEGEKDTAWSQLLQCGKIQLLVTLQRIVDGTAVLGKGRRIEHNQVILSLGHLLEKLKSIICHSLVPRLDRKSVV